VAIVVDTVAQNAAMVEKLLIPFPILSDSDPEGAVIRSAGVWDERGLIARPAIFLLDRDRRIHYAYVGMDFVDRPGDDELFAALDGLHRQDDSDAPR
jgi:peroxiredoxin